MSTQFIKSLASRRTIYALKKDNFPVKNEQIVKIVEDVIAVVPSAFNNQTNRALVIFGDKHDQLWNQIAYNALKAVVPAEQFASTEGKLKSFAAGYGTVLFFQDQEIVRNFENKFPPFAHNFGPWAEQSSGAAQINTWTAFALEGVGASLQHYSELISEKVAAEYSIPPHWKLSAQLVFGAKAGEAGPKETLPASQTVKTA